MTDHPQSRTHRVATGVDRLLLDQLDELLEQSPSYRDLPVVVVNETEGTVAAELRSRGMPLRVVQDSALLFDRLRAQADLAHEPWDDVMSREILQGAGTVLYRLPRPLEAVEETAWHVARWAKETVVLLAGARQKDLQRSVNDRLGQYFGHVSASRGAYKARVIRARDPHLPDATRQTPPRIPRVNTDRVLDHELALRAYGLTFGAARVDPGTRLMLETILGTPMLSRMLSEVRVQPLIWAVVMARWLPCWDWRPPSRRLLPPMIQLPLSVQRARPWWRTGWTITVASRSTTSPIRSNLLMRRLIWWC